MNTVRVLLVESDFIFRFVLNSFLDKTTEIKIIGEAKGISDALEKILHANPDVVLSDLTMIKTQTNIIHLIKRIYPETIFGILLPDSISEYSKTAIEYGADFTLTRDNIVEQLIPTIKSIILNRSGHENVSTLKSIK